MAFGGAWYTLLVVSFNQMVTGDGSNLLTEEEIELLTPESIESRIAGSKWVFVSEHAMLLTIWYAPINPTNACQTTNSRPGV